MGGFFEMGGYAAFVWPSFAVTTVVMIAIWVISRRNLRRAEAELKALENLSEAGNASRNQGNGAT